MFRQSAFAVLFALSAAASGGAFAMDVPPPVYAPETSISGVGQGWYIRGDLGYTGWTGDETPDYGVITGGGGSSVREFDRARFDNDMSYGAGAGYQFNDIFRADATFDMYNSNVDGHSLSTSRCEAGQGVGTNCGFNHAGDFRALGVMGNLYADLGTFAGFTPYIGGGAGATHVAWDNVTESPYCIDAGGTCNGTAYATNSYEGMDSWRFSYALMAGVSYDISSSMKLDFGYRYSKVAGGDMYEYGAAEKALGGAGAKGSDDGLSRHEIRAGLRLNTW
jgi:opacity protein-like surface antigen